VKAILIPIFLFLVGISIGASFFNRGYWWVGSAVVVASLILIVRWHAKNFFYICSKCGEEFKISTVMDFISPHGLSKSGGWKYLKCPKCKKWSRAKIIKCGKE